MNDLPFRGAATAVVTPFKNGEIDFSAFRRLIEMQTDAGITTLVICGTTGEAPSLTEKEKLSLFAAAIEYSCGKAKIIAGCGSPSTAFTCSLARQAEQLGVDAFLTVTPYYNKCTAEGLYLHYRTIADTVSLPIIAYNVPSRTGFDIPLEAYERLATIENLVAVKEASGNVSKAEAILSEFGRRFALYSGNDDLIAPIYALGGSGVISVISNVLPSETKTLCRLCEEGKSKEAARLQLYLLPLIRLLFTEVSPIPVKAALGMMGLCENELRLPLTPASEALSLRLKDALIHYGTI